MNLLAIDTSTEYISVGLSVGGKLKNSELRGQRQHAQVILPMIEQLLAEGGLQLSQLDAIVYGRGPGSFTGLRIACSVAKGLAYAHDLPLFPVSSLAAIAEEAFYHTEDDASSVLAMIDARMNQVYWACLAPHQYEVQESVDAVANITVSPVSPLILAGVGFEPYFDQLSPVIQERIIKKCLIYPQAQAMIRIALSGKIQAISAAKASPVYIRNQVTQGEPRG
ncbi:glycoprotease (O-sialoglycoprotein endopeptidase) [Legionella lansingensis]|uniref:tRNA threonylcarbamoyladenosine biosynthesis protein TsaB n=1 Tax=Legionella lansingensis TaxID=45067 RepID=A0A0W0VU72_9GAMM|nr:tRNA (adenosine(37)-N6)-threonylcarbamoyltransferase complex dimerization subunit type 1 TsaB [Legionella lansingensis]KTD23602.1 O-sialoglycoprotein endopeptidase [Legionella lansingensis]SNV52384.1 glycoprotease (O-sialoglycoprotein endopeptidase) [Legionella lansingensis]